MMPGMSTKIDVSGADAGSAGSFLSNSAHVKRYLVSGQRVFGQPPLEVASIFFRAAEGRGCGICFSLGTSLLTRLPQGCQDPVLLCRVANSSVTCVLALNS
jgi:hypothetical protein